MEKVKQIKTELTKSMKNKEQNKVVMLRILLAEMENKKVELKLNNVEDLKDVQVEEVCMQQVKKLDQEIEGLLKAGRDTGKVLEQKEVVYEYLPKQLTEQEIEDVVTEKIKEMNVTNIKEQGKVMGVLSKELKGKADMGTVSKLVRGILGRM